MVQLISDTGQQLNRQSQQSSVGLSTDGTNHQDQLFVAELPTYTTRNDENLSDADCGYKFQTLNPAVF